MTYMGSGDRGPQPIGNVTVVTRNAAGQTQMLITNEHLTAAELPVYPSRPPPRRTARSCASQLGHPSPTCATR